jgi:flagellar basal-body rod protein FlgC
MTPSFKVPVSGMTAAVRRVQATAANIANAGSTASLDAVAEVAPVNPARPDTRDAYAGYRPVRIHQASVAGGGTEAVATPVNPSFVRAYQPTHPDAGKYGIVKRPNVSLEGELVELMRAQRAYEANLKVVQTLDEMLGTLVDSRV